MPRPQTKDELLESSKKNFNRLNELINTFSDEEKEPEFPKGTLNRNVRDVLAHLHHWNSMTLGWYKVGMEGGKPNMPAEGYTWKTLPDLNKSIQRKYENRKLKEVRTMFNESFDELQKVIHKHSDKELFEKKKYKWTGTTSLGSYLISAASSHYEWAFKLIKRAKK
jgi:hypothetical protein